MNDKNTRCRQNKYTWRKGALHARQELTQVFPGGGSMYATVLHALIKAKGNTKQEHGLRKAYAEDFHSYAV